MGDNVAMGQIFPPESFGFPLLVSFYHYNILIHVIILGTGNVPITGPVPQIHISAHYNNKKQILS
jgi:hypothetical protein